MPTEDYSNSSRTAKLRQKASLKGLGKVARALDYDTQLSMKLGGVVQKTKNSSGITYDCACPPNVNTSCVGTFTDAGTDVSYTCDGNTCVETNVIASLEYLQINAVPGTIVSSNGPSSEEIIVNCTSSPVTVVLDIRNEPGIGKVCSQEFEIGILEPGMCFVNPASGLTVYCLPPLFYNYFFS